MIFFFFRMSASARTVCFTTGFSSFFMHYSGFVLYNECKGVHEKQKAIRQEQNTKPDGDPHLSFLFPRVCLVGE